MRRILILITAMIVMGSCNQMGGSGDVAEGGIGGSGISTGPITDFGSIFVYDIEWFIDDSEIEFDGEAGSEDDLRIGMVVRVQGEIDKENRTGEASEVFFDDELEGPIESIVVIEAEQTKELTILGQKVWIDVDSTRFDDDVSPDFGFDSIGVDDVVEVSGLLDHLGVIRAPHVEREGVVVLGVTEVEFQGLISGFTGGGSSFMIGEVTVTFDPEGNDTDLSDLPGGPANGVLVEVEGVFNAVNQVFAIEIELEDEFDEDRTPLIDATDEMTHPFVASAESDVVASGRDEGARTAGPPIGRRPVASPSPLAAERWRWFMPATSHRKKACKWCAAISSSRVRTRTPSPDATSWFTSRRSPARRPAPNTSASTPRAPGPSFTRPAPPG